MSKRLPWFRMYVDFLNDAKMVKLAFEDQRHFIGLLALKSDGALDDEDCDSDLLDRIVAQRLWIDHAIIREVKKRLIAAGLIDDRWQPIAWERRQFSSDSSAERTRRYRERNAKRPSTPETASPKRHSDCAEAYTDADTDGEAEKELSADAAFDVFWSAGMVKTGRKSARKAFDAALKREKRKPGEFAEALAKDVKRRIERGQFGFESLHPSTYLNGNRWEDDMPKAKGARPGVAAITSQQRSFKDVDYGENRIPSWLQDVADDAGSRQ